MVSGVHGHHGEHVTSDVVAVYRGDSVLVPIHALLTVGGIVGVDDARKDAATVNPAE